MSSILLFNTSFRNRGDALMAQSVLQKLGPSHRWSVAADVMALGGGQPAKMMPALVSMLPGNSAKQRLFNQGVALADSLFAMIPRSVRRQLPLVSRREVDLALDLSGYCFGDHWGQAWVERATITYRQLRQAGAKIVLMPRTWGPFTTIDSRSLNALFDHLHLAFGRDQRSLANIGDKLDSRNRAKLSFAPDYTHAVQPNVARWPIAPGAAMLIPNSRIIDSGTMPRGDYLDLFAAARAQLAGAGLKPRLLIHETANDLAFIDEASSMGFAADEVLVPESAIAAKSMIAQASAVVTSRLHGLYNALNSAVPVAAITWSFKYVEALDHYHCAECLVDLDNSKASLHRTIEMITDPERISHFKAAMRKGKAEQMARTDAMWERVLELAGVQPDDQD
jgi:colanic acid/amylovoran biosynthesis protein